MLSNVNIMSITHLFFDITDVIIRIINIFSFVNAIYMTNRYYQILLDIVIHQHSWPIQNTLDVHRNPIVLFHVIIHVFHYFV